MSNYIEDFKYWLTKVSADEAKELEAIKDNDEQLKRRFAIPLEFGTAGMRGIIALGTGCLNRYTVRRATQGVANFIKQVGNRAMEKGVVISYDTRNFSCEFALETAGVLASNGIKVYLYNDTHPVPMCSFAIRYLKAFAGIMITASHNPKEYNGYKVYGEDGAQMSPEDTAVVVKYIDAIKDYFCVKGDEIKASREQIKSMNNKMLQENIMVIGKPVEDAYFAELAKLSLSPEAVSEVASKIKIVYTPLHGSGYKPVTTILKQMKIPCNVVEEQKEPDGNFPTVAVPNPEQPDALKMGINLAKQLRSNIVIGTDPDADRMGVAIKDNNGEFVLLSGNQIGAMMMNYILMRRKDMGILPANGAVVKTIVTTNLADMIAKSYGMEVYNVLTGFKFIGEKIKEWEANGKHTFLFGYEESFGYLSGTHARDKDAVVSAMLFAEMACYYESKNIKLYDVLQDLYKKFGYFVEVSKSIAFGGVNGMAEMKAVMDKLRNRPINNIAGLPVLKFMDLQAGVSKNIDGSEQKIELPKTNVLKFMLSEDEWCCVRPSGTEPKLKIYVSVKGDTQELAKIKNQNVLGFVEMLVNN